MMIRFITMVMLAAFFAAPSPADGERILHPERLLAGAWQIPFFVHLEEQPAATPLLDVQCGEESRIVPFQRIPSPTGRISYGLMLTEPLLVQIPDETLQVRVWVGESLLYESSIPVVGNPGDCRILSVQEDGEAVVWDLDGGGGLTPYDTVRTDAAFEDALLLEDGRGRVIVAGVTGSGDLVFSAGADGLRETDRVRFGSRVSCVASGRNRREGFIGLLDGRIVRVDAGGAASTRIVATPPGIPVSIAVGDLNHDSFPDLVAIILEMERSVLMYWPGNSNGTFDRNLERVVPLPAPGRTVLFTDPGGIGKRELVLLLHGGASGLSGVFIWEMNGEDLFGDDLHAVDLKGAGKRRPRGCLAGDWDGDGKADLGLLVGAGGSSIELFLMEDAWTGGSPIDTIDVGGVEVDVLVADLDGNGADDILVAEGRFSIWLNDGTGRMVESRSRPSGRAAKLCSSSGH